MKNKKKVSICGGYWATPKKLKSNCVGSKKFVFLLSVTKAREDDQAQLKNHQDRINQLKNVVEEVSTRMETMSTWVSNNE